MKELKKIKNVSKYLIDGNQLYLQVGNTILSQNKVVKDLETNFFGEFYVNNDKLIVQSNYGEFELNNIKYKGYYNYLNTKNISFLNSSEKLMYVIEDEIITNTNLRRPYYEIDNSAYTISVNNVQAFSLFESKFLWQYDLSTLGEYLPLRKKSHQNYEVKKFLGIWQDQLLVACSNGLILCLDTLTGKEVRRFHQCTPYQLGSKTYEHINNAVSFVLDAKKNILFALHTYYYKEIELDTGHIKITYLREDMTAKNILIYTTKSDYAWDDTHIYSIADVAEHYGGQALGDKCLVAFNRSTKSIDWQHVFEGDSINTSPQISGNKLYQLSAKNVLYIFEKNS